jgi:hypothetical protein
MTTGYCECTCVAQGFGVKSWDVNSCDTGLVHNPRFAAFYVRSKPGTHAASVPPSSNYTPPHAKEDLMSACALRR